MVSTRTSRAWVSSQDCKDADSDRAIGRQKTPMVLGHAAKYTVIAPFCMWSAGLSLFWDLDNVTAVVLRALTVYVGAPYLRAETLYECQLAFKRYKVSPRSRHCVEY